MARITIEKNIAFDDVKNRYYVTLYFGVDENGKAKKNIKSCKTLEEARAILKRHNAEVLLGTAVQSSSALLADYVDDYIAYKSKFVEETTLYGYRNIASHVRRFFKRQKLQDIHPMNIRRYIDDLIRNQKLSENTVNKHLALLGSVFHMAVNDGLVLKNPIDAVEKPKQKQKEPSCYNFTQFDLLLNSVKHTDLEIPVLLGGLLGLRRGEVAKAHVKTLANEKAEGESPLLFCFIRRNSGRGTSRFAPGCRLYRG